MRTSCVPSKDDPWMSNALLTFAGEVRDLLLDPRTIRRQSQRLLDRLEDGQGAWQLDRSAFPGVVDFVWDVIQSQYPTFDVPFHSRWRHFQVPGRDALAELQARLAGLSAEEQLAARLDLTIVSVLLDAGAGARWSYQCGNGPAVARSEGLALASLDMFMAGSFSSVPDQPYRVDAAGLSALTLEQLAAGFQVSEANPLVGLEGRWALLQRLAEQMGREPHRFGAAPARPSRPFRALLGGPGPVAAQDVLVQVLEGLGPIWSGQVCAGGLTFGDVWHHPELGPRDAPESWVPFHKLPQWLSYSLLEPLCDAGAEVAGLDELTGLAEYRNGGLFVDLGVLTLTDKGHGAAYRVDDPVIVEWRAATILLLDEVAQQIRDRQGVTAAELPLVKVLEGGTWAAGRRAAREKRQDGSSPLELERDGTVF